MCSQHHGLRLTSLRGCEDQTDYKVLTVMLTRDKHLIQVSYIVVLAAVVAMNYASIRACLL